MNVSFVITMLFLLLTVTSHCYASNKDSALILLPDEIKIKGDKIIQPLSYSASVADTYKVKINSYQLGITDSTQLFASEYPAIILTKGVHKFSLELTKAGNQKFFNPVFQELLLTNKKYPAGNFVFNVQLIQPQTNDTIYQRTLFIVDSLIDIAAGARDKINKTFKSKKIFQWASIIPKPKISSPITPEQISRVTNRIQQKSGYDNTPKKRGDKWYSSVYYKNWFVGYYEIKDLPSLKSKIDNETNQLNTDPSGFVSTDFGKLPSIPKQLKDLKKKKENEINGTFELTSGIGNGQESGSQLLNNYVNVHTALNTKVANIPVGVECYYTTMDKNRHNKASYFRVHYDIEEAKSELNQLITGYKTKFQEAEAKGSGYSMIYNDYLNKLEQEQNKLNNEITRINSLPSLKTNTNNTASSGSIENFTSSLTNKLEQSAKDSALSKVGNTKASKEKDSLQNVVREKQQRLLQISQKIEKYQGLLDQYINRLKMDSALVNKNINKVNNSNDMSYKDMAKSASDLLPDGKVKKFTTGLTRLDAGIINEYQSNYTMGGQTLKGGSMGYDIGFSTISMSVGKTEYVGRDGSVDPYSCVLLRSDFKQWNKQKFGIIYYNYSASKKAFDGNQPIKNDLSIPSFSKPTHIYSLCHEGTILKNLNMQNELATSYKQGLNTESIAMSNSAIKSSLDYLFPKVNVAVQGTWEHVGKSFENQSLPFNKAASEHYTLATQTDLFHSFISVGVQYNLMKQETFATEATSVKWGFDIKTNTSKRYPSFMVSYKPFSSFRAYNDTSIIQQRPMTGSVWMAKSSYQLKRNGKSYRFSLVYNQNTTSATDSQNYKSQTIQANVIYLHNTNMISLNTGWMRMPVIRPEGTKISQTFTVSSMVSKKILKSWDVSLGEDLAVGTYGIERIGGNTSIGYRFKKQPVSMNLMGRYAHIEQAFDGNKNLWLVQLGINWQIHLKLNTNKESKQ